MNENTENLVMKSAFVVMNRILKYVEQSLDDDFFDAENFTPDNFSVSKNRFARLLKMLSDSGYVEGIEVVDRGEPDEFSPKNYERFKIILSDGVSVTVKGLQFLAENAAWVKMYRVAKEIRGFVG